MNSTSPYKSTPLTKDRNVLISTLTGRPKIGVFDDKRLEYLYIDDDVKDTANQGDIYLGQVSKISNGLEAAFVEIGQKRTAFLHKSDIALTQEAQSKPLNKILTTGQRFLVQISKSAMGTKGARLTTKISLSTGYLVYLPHMKTNKLSSKITCERQRETLYRMLEHFPKCGFILRTAACNQPLATLMHDCEYLENKWQDIQQQSFTMLKPGLINKDLSLPFKIIRDFVKLGLKEVIVDNKVLKKQIEEYCSEFLPQYYFEKHFHPHTLSLNQFSQQIEKIYEPTVHLDCGGSLVIEQTESMTTIDVNTGGYLGHGNHQETIFKTNLQASKVIIDEIKVRQIGGIIIVDFIDMDSVEHQKNIEQALIEASKDDIMPSTIYPMTELALIQISRKRSGESLFKKQTTPCLCCQLQGRILHSAALFDKIIEDILSMKNLYQDKKVQVLVNQSLHQHFQDRETVLGLIKRNFKIEISTVFQENLPNGQFEITLLG